MDESDLIFPEINNEFNYNPYEHVSPNIIFEPTPVRSYKQPSYESPPSYAVQEQQQRAARRAQLQKSAHESFQFQMNDARARAENHFNNRTPFVDAQTFIQQNPSLKFHGKILENGLVEYHPYIPINQNGQGLDYGAFKSNRQDPHLQHIVKAADEKALQEIASSIKLWLPMAHVAFESYKDIYDEQAASLNEKYSDLAKDFGNYTFKPSVLYTMFKYQISPWEAVDALNYGNAKMSQSYNPFLRIYTNESKTIHVLLNINSTNKSDVLAVARDDDPLQEYPEGEEKRTFNARKEKETAEIERTRKIAWAQEQKEFDARKFQDCVNRVQKFSPELREELASFDDDPLNKSIYEFNREHGKHSLFVQGSLLYPSALKFLIEHNMQPWVVQEIIARSEKKPWIHNPKLIVAVNDEKDTTILMSEWFRQVITIFKGADLGRELNTIKPEPVATKEPQIAEAHKQTKEQAINDVQRIAHKLGSFSEQTLCELSENYLNDLQNPTPSEWTAPKDLESSENLTFNGWNFLPPALFGMMVCNVTPYMATSAIESALCTAGSASTVVATTLAPAITINPTLACVALAGTGALVIYDNAEKIITRVLRATKVLESAITGCMSLVSACVDALLQPKYFSHGSAYEELAYLKYILIQAQERDAQATTKGLSREAEPQPQPEPKTERKPNPTAEPEPEPAPPEPQPSPPVPVKSNPPSKTGPIIETTFEEHPSGGRPPPEPPKDDLAKAAASAFGFASFFFNKAFELQTISTALSNSAQTPTVATPAPVVRDLTPTNLYRLDENIKDRNHIVNGSLNHDHQMQLVVPDKNWPEIRKIVQEIMETGKEGVFHKNYKMKYAYVNNYPVVVKYRFSTKNENAISGIFVPQKDLIDQFIPKDDIRWPS